MNTQTSSNNIFSFIPKSLCLMLVLILATETYIYMHRPQFIDDYWNKFLINETQLIQEGKDYSYLILGNSIQKTGIRPRDVHPDLLNLGLPGAKPMDHYLLLKRYLKHHAAPQVVFMYIDPEDPRDSRNVVLRYFVTLQDFFGIARYLTWDQITVFWGRYFSSLDLRKVDLSKRDVFSGTNDDFVRGLIMNGGFMPLPNFDQELPDDYFLVNGERLMSAPFLYKNDREYIHQIIQLTQKHGIKLVLLSMLVPEQLHGMYEDSGFNQAYGDYLRSIQKDFSQVIIPENSVIFYPNKFFGDQSHLNEAGSDRYTLYFKDQILQTYATL